MLLPNEIGVNINTYLNLFLLFFLVPSDPVMLVCVCVKCVLLSAWTVMCAIIKSCWHDKLM